MPNLRHTHCKKTKLRVGALLALVPFVSTAEVKAQSFSASQSTVYYDADEINLDKETGNLKAKGHAFFLLGNVFVSADHVEYNQKQKIMIAEGGVRIVRSRERITASRILLNEQSNEARMDDVEIYADPKDTDAQINEEVLGFSRAELAFELARQERSKEIKQELQEIRTNYANLLKTQGTKSKAETERIFGRYAQLLERLVRTQYQPSDVLRDLPEEARKRIENRREAVRTFATRDPGLAKKLAGLQKVPGYLSMRARRVFQNSNQNLDVESASITTCRCQADENPVWGLSASRALVEPNEYITLYGSTLEVGHFPFLYSPWFKMPIKTKRQSGFLLPSFYLSRAGDAATFPYYVTLGESADATATFTYFSKRGPRGEMELRTALSEESHANFHGEILDQKATENITASTRWAWNADSNLPLDPRTSFKFDLEQASDQRYFSDLTKEPGTTQDLFTPQLIIKRYLWQEVGLEHLGEHLAISARLQKPQDVFEENSNHTPARLPRLDLTLFPRNIGESGVSYEANGLFENIAEKENPDGSKTRGPLDGTRSSGRLRVNYPVAPNRIFNMRIGNEFGHINYETFANRGNLNFAQLDISADLPFVGEFALSSSPSAERSLKHGITPFASLRWVPLVEKTAQYPDIYSTYYAADNIARSQIIEFGIQTDLNFVKDEFQPVERTDTQIGAAGQQLQPPGRENIVLALTNYQPTAGGPDTGQFLYSLTRQGSRSEMIFKKWARQELSEYLSELKKQELTGETFFINSKPKSWRRTNVIAAHPAGFSLRSSYNFEAVRTAAEQNRNLQPGQTPISPDPWGDIAGTLTLSSHPWVPLSGSMTRVWRPAWRLFKDQSASLDYASSFGFYVNLVRSVSLSESVDSVGNKSYPEEQLWGIDTSYLPKPWLKFQIQYRRNLKPQPAISRELEYSSLQKITFLGVQDCVDITLQRFKDREIAERLATWTIGLNLTFLGQQRQIESLGKVVDRAIKSQLNKGQNLNLQ